MSHFKLGGYAYITPTIGVVGRTGDRVDLTTRKFNDVDAIFLGSGGNYETMGAPSPYRYYGGGSPLPAVSKFYNASDVDGSPGSTTPPDEYEIFAFVRDNGAAFSCTMALSRKSSGFIYASTSDSFFPSGTWQTLGIAVPSGNTGFVTTRLGQGDVEIYLNDTTSQPTGAEVTYRLDSLGLRYALLGGTSPAGASGPSWAVGSY